MSRIRAVGQYSSKHYVTIAGLRLLFGCMLFWGAIAPDHTSTPAHFVRLTIAALFLLCALQPIERLLYPERAQRRSDNLANAPRLRLGSIRSLRAAILVLGMLTVGIMRLAKMGYGSDILLVTLSISDVAVTLADFCGQPDFPR